jgi:hypothetical protein
MSEIKIGPRKAFGSLLVLACLSFSASAQTQDACREQLRHFAVPEYPPAFSTVAPGGKAKLPTRLLSSQGGIEVYANTFPTGRDTFVTQISETGLKVLVVYQDEPMRQAMIKELRDKNALPPRGMGALVDNLKYAEILFMPDWLPSDLASGNKMGLPFERKWSIRHIEYDQPKSCMNVFQNDVHPTPFNAYAASVSTISETDPIHLVKINPDDFPLWAKALQAMLAWAKECVSLVDRTNS